MFFRESFIVSSHLIVALSYISIKLYVFLKINTSFFIRFTNGKYKFNVIHFKAHNIQLNAKNIIFNFLR